MRIVSRILFLIFFLSSTFSMAELACRNTFKVRYLHLLASPVPGYLLVPPGKWKVLRRYIDDIAPVYLKFSQHEKSKPGLVRHSDGALYKTITDQGQPFSDFLIDSSVPPQLKENLKIEFERQRDIFYRLLREEFEPEELKLVSEASTEYLPGKYVKNYSMAIPSKNIRVLLGFKSFTVDMKTLKLDINLPFVLEGHKGGTYAGLVFRLPKVDQFGNELGLETYDALKQLRLELAQRRNSKAKRYEKNRLKNLEQIDVELDQIEQKSMALGHEWISRLRLVDDPLGVPEAFKKYRGLEVDSKGSEEINRLWQRVFSGRTSFRDQNRILLMEAFSFLVQTGVMNKNQAMIYLNASLGIINHTYTPLAEVRSLLVVIHRYSEFLEKRLSRDSIEFLEYKIVALKEMNQWMIKRLAKLEQYKNPIEIKTAAFRPMASTFKLSELKTMSELESHFDVLARRTQVFSTMNNRRAKDLIPVEPLAEVDNAFLSTVRGIPEAFLGFVSQGRLDMEFIHYDRVYAIGHRGAIEFSGHYNSGPQPRYYAVIFQKGFVKHFGSVSSYGAEPVSPSNFLLGKRINSGRDKVFPIYFEYATKDQGQVHIYPAWSNLVINGRAQTHTDFFRSHALGVVEFNDRGEIMALKEFR